MHSNNTSTRRCTIVEWTAPEDVPEVNEKGYVDRRNLMKVTVATIIIIIIIMMVMRTILINGSFEVPVPIRSTGRHSRTERRW